MNDFQVWRLPSGLKKECRNATKILRAVLKDTKGDLTGTTEMKETEKDMYHRHLQYSAGIIVMKFVKVAFIGSVRYGNGLMFARLPNGKWSAPACVETGGIGFGASFGLAISNEVFFMNEAAVKAFKKGGNITVGGEVQLTLFSLGRGVEGDIALGKTRQGAQIYSFSKSAGLYGAVEIQTGGIHERKKDNYKYYGDNITINDILDGKVVAQVEDISELYAILDSGGNVLPIGLSPLSSDDEHHVHPEHQHVHPEHQHVHPDQYHAQPQYNVQPGQYTHDQQLPYYDATIPQPPLPQKPLQSPPDQIYPVNDGNTTFNLNTDFIKPQTKYKAKFDFLNGQMGELSFRKDEVFVIEDKPLDGWWIAINDKGEKGRVPSNYLDPI